MDKKQKCEKIVELFSEVIKEYKDLCVLYDEQYGYIVLSYYEMGHFECNSLFNEPEALYGYLVKVSRRLTMEKYAHENETGDIENDYWDYLTAEQKKEITERELYFENRSEEILAE